MIARLRLRSIALAALAVGTLALAGCGSADREDFDEVIAAIDATRAELSGFVYAEIFDSRKVEVRGGIEDDFRYEARVFIDNEPVFDEIVSDDALADRVLDEAALTEFYAPSGLPTSATKRNDEGLSVAAAFETRRWVLDDDGAPDLLASRDVAQDQGKDPIYDALTVLDYLESTVLRQNTIVRFDRNDIDYSPQDDPFPTPEKGSGIRRYDVRPPGLPRQSDTQQGNQAVPSTGHFRKLAVYVRDGRIVQILENIDVVSRLDEIERNYDLDLAGLDAPAAAELSIEAINRVRVGQGDEPIRVRIMSATFTDEDVTVRLPTDSVVAGDLDGLSFRGRSGTPGADEDPQPTAGEPDEVTEADPADA